MYASSVLLRLDRHEPSKRLVLLLSVASGLLLGTVQQANAADPPASAPFASSDSDTVLALKVKSALAADRDLAGLTLMISVVDRVAVIGGPVPSAELQDRIEKVLRKLPGLADVKVSCWVTTGEDPLKSLVGARLRGDEKNVPPTSPRANVNPLVVVPRLEPQVEPSPMPTIGLAPRPADQVKVPEPSADSRMIGTVTVQRMPMPSSASGFLLDPVTTGGKVVAEPLARPLGTGTIPAQDVPTSPDGAARSATLVSLPKDARFAGLTVNMKNGTAVICGRVKQHADTWDFAASVRKLPGVERVVLGNVEVR